jgi:cullin 1
MSMLVWRSICWTGLRQRVLDAALSMIDRDRDGEQADKPLLGLLVQMYISIGLEEDTPLEFYRREFRDPFLSRTREYYLKESTDFLAHNSVSAYMAKAELRLNQEMAAAQQFLHQTTPSELQKTLEEVLIQKHMETLQNEFQSMLANDREDDMRRFFFLLSRLPDGLNQSSATLRSYLKNRGDSIVKEQSTKLKTKAAVKNSGPLIDALLELHKHYAGIVMRCFSDNKLFVQALDEAFTYFINKEVGAFTTAELLNFYVDNLLKGAQKLSEAQLEETLQSIVRLFSYFDDKDVFYLAFRRSLSKRLLSRKFRESDEMSFIQKLKMRCGDAYTKKLEGMFNDIKVSSDKMPEYKDWMKERGTKLPISDMNVIVLNDINWPLSKQTDLILPSEMHACVSSFEEFYKSTTDRRRLTWLYNQGTVSIQHTFLDEKKRPKRIEVIVSAIQAAVLMLFNVDQPKSFKDIQAELGVTDEMLKFSIAPLVYAKFPLLKRKAENDEEEEEEAAAAEKPKAAAASKGGDDDDDGDDGDDDDGDDDGKKSKKRQDKEDEVVLESDIFSLAKETKPPRNRIQYPPGSAQMLKKEAKEIKDKTQEDRNMKMELALVRVMKSRNICTLNELIAEASNQLMPFFRPDIKQMKKRIEALMERGFMRRDDADQRKIHYVA